MFLVTFNRRMYNGMILRSVKQALIRQALDVGFWSVLERVLVDKYKLKRLKVVWTVLY